MNREILSKPRMRRDASKVLAVALQSRYRKLLEASGEDETVVATADLAQCMYENIEFVIWALKAQGGMNPAPPEELRKITPPQPANDPRFTKPPPPSVGGFRFPDGSLDDCTDEPAPLDLPCNCPPLEPGIIGYKHMASCPKFVPA